MTARHADDVAARLAEIRSLLKEHIQAGRWHWATFSGEDVEFLLALIDGGGADD